ncbi:MAG: sigma-70 family RNA polymerase sigma factor [Planctomycetota bacterium]
MTAVSDSDPATSNAPGDDILPRVAAGEAGAVDACIKRYGGLVWSLARRVCSNPADADDAVQDAFISLWKSAGRFDASMGSEPTFVAMITRRRLIDRVRRVTRRPDTASLDAAMGSGLDPSEPRNRQMGPGGSPDAGVQISEESDIARQALNELSEDQQRVLRLSVLHGVSHEKISEATGLPLGTVKTHIRRGLIKVRQVLAERRASAGSDRGQSVEVTP